MLSVHDGADALEIVSTLPTGQRVLFGLLALFPLIAPYELLIRPRWERYFNLFFLFALVVALGAVAVSLFLAAAALAGLDTRLRFDWRQGVFSYTAGAPVVPWRTLRYPLAQVAAVQVATTEWSDGPPSYAVQVVTQDGRQFQSSSSASRAEIEAIVQKVSPYIGPV